MKIVMLFKQNNNLYIGVGKIINNDIELNDIITHALNNIPIYKLLVFNDNMIFGKIIILSSNIDYNENAYLFSFKSYGNMQIIR